MNWLRDFVGLSGFGIVLYGLSLWSTALAIVAGGGFLMFGALAWALLGGKR
jgi:hypothetical protein